MSLDPSSSNAHNEQVLAALTLRSAAFYKNKLQTVRPATWQQAVDYVRDLETEEPSVSFIEEVNQIKWAPESSITQEEKDRSEKRGSTEGRSYERYPSRERRPSTEGRPSFGKRVADRPLTPTERMSRYEERRPQGQFERSRSATPEGDRRPRSRSWSDPRRRAASHERQWMRERRFAQSFGRTDDRRSRWDRPTYAGKAEQRRQEDRGGDRQWSGSREPSLRRHEERKPDTVDMKELKKLLRKLIVEKKERRFFFKGCLYVNVRAGVADRIEYIRRQRHSDFSVSLTTVN